MLKISPQQMTLIKDSTRESVAQALALALRPKYDGVFQFYSQAQLNTWVIEQLLYLESHNIVGEDTTKGIIELLAVFGARFERCEDPSWALDIIENAQEDENRRYVKLLRATTQQFDLASATDHITQR